MKFIQKNSRTFGRLIFIFCQMQQRIEFSFIVDWGGSSIIFELTFLFWSFEIVYYKHKKDAY